MRNIFIRISYKLAVTIAAVGLAVALGQNSTLAQSSEGPGIMPPANDMFASAEPIDGPKGFLVGTNMNAGLEPGEPIVYEGGQSVWYRWASPGNVSITFDVRSYDESRPGISIYNGLDVTKLLPMGHGAHFDRVTFIAQGKGEYSIQITSKSSQSAGTFQLTWDVNGAETWKQFNFDGQVDSVSGPPTGKSDFAIYRWWSLSQPTGQFWIYNGNDGSNIVYNFGEHTLAPVHMAPGDYDGDGRTDIAFFQKQTHEFWIFQSETATVRVQPWGLSADNPVQGDFDGDDMADIAIFRPGDGVFWVLKSSDGLPMVMPWGTSGDVPVCGDYDGDGITDFAVRRGSGSGPATFYLLRSSDHQMVAFFFGFDNDLVVPGDYDGDGKNDLAVFRPSNSTFYYMRSLDGEVYMNPLGMPFENNDRIVPGDYFGDNRSDFIIWKFRTGDFYAFPDAGNAPQTMFHFGLQGDEPVGFSNVH